MSRIVYLPAADDDLLEIFETIAADDGMAAERFVARIRRSILRLADFPLSAPARHELGADIRSLPVGAYRVLHCVEGDTVSVVRIIHAARDLPPLDG